MVNGFPAPNMNLCFVPKLKDVTKYGGFGIYSISYNDEKHGDRVVYLGKFAGCRLKVAGVDMANGGDIRDRWFKHIGTATLLLNKLKMGSERLYRVQRKAALTYFHDHASFEEVYPASFVGIPEKTLSTSVFIKGADLQVSKNRLGFAIQNLTATNRARPSNKDELNEVISRFTCHYWRVISTTEVRKSQINGPLTGSKKAPGVESSLIDLYASKLPMNDRYSPPSLPNRDFFHYDPQRLIVVDSEEYQVYSKRITTALVEKFSFDESRG